MEYNAVPGGVASPKIMMQYREQWCCKHHQWVRREMMWATK